MAATFLWEGYGNEGWSALPRYAPVLAAPPSPAPSLRLYAHCLRGRAGGVALVAINLGDTDQSIAVGRAARAWLMRSTAALDTKTITINGTVPHADDRGALTGLEPVRTGARLTISGRSIAYVTVDAARNPACR